MIELGRRRILWVGSHTYLITLQARPGKRRLLRVDESPVCPVLTTGSEWEELAPWLAQVCSRGDVVDILYQHHWLRVETFPPLASGDLEGALKARLAREMLHPPDTLVRKVTRHDAKGKTQAILAATNATTHLSVVRGFEAAGIEPGRVGFAGQLALRELLSRFPDGSWTVLEDVACAEALLVACSAEGQVLTESLTGGGHTTEQLREKIELSMPRATVPAEPCVLASLEPRKGWEAIAAELPAPMGTLVPIFTTEPEWRIPSQEDLDYPYHFGLPTWGLAIAASMLIFYSGYLLSALLQIALTSGEVARLELRKAELEASGKEKQTRVKALDYLTKNVRGVGAETFDNAAWMRYLGQTRDKSTPSLLFDSLQLRGETLTLAGEAADSTPILAFFENLADGLGEEQARMRSMRQAKGSNFTFQIDIVRETSSPPAVSEL